MILQTGQEINELESSGFHTEGPTVFCGNISASANGGSGNNYIVQVANSVQFQQKFDIVLIQFCRKILQR